MYIIADNLGNIGEADNPASAATAVQTLIEDNPDTVTTIMVTKRTEENDIEGDFDAIVKGANAYMGWGT